jgi:hypothetical protein
LMLAVFASFRVEISFSTGSNGGQFWKQKMHKNRTETLHELNKYISLLPSVVWIHQC